METLILIRILFAALQSKGRLGKSWIILLLAAWLDRHGVAWAGFDLDDSHRSLARRYPDVKELTVTDEITGHDELLKIYRTALSGAVPVVLADTRAQLSPLVIDSLHRSQFFKLAEGKGARMTVLVFPADDDDSLRSLVEGVQQTGRQVDYLVIRNPALYQSRRNDGSPLQRTFLATGAEEIVMPALLESTRRAISRAETECGHALSFPEAIDRLKDFAKADLEFFLSGAFQEFDRVAHLLLPTVQASTIARPAPKKGKDRLPFAAVGINLGEEE
jgi:hypothetical protein